jgi:hypothetical protein
VAKTKADSAATISVLVTVSEPHRNSLEGMARKLSRAGLKVADTYALGGVIAGEVSPAKMAALGRVEGVAEVEQDRQFDTGPLPD